MLADYLPLSPILPFFECGTLANFGLCPRLYVHRHRLLKHVRSVYGRRWRRASDYLEVFRNLTEFCHNFESMID